MTNAGGRLPTDITITFTVNDAPPTEITASFVLSSLDTRGRATVDSNLVVTFARSIALDNDNWFTFSCNERSVSTSVTSNPDNTVYTINPISNFNYEDDCSFNVIDSRLDSTSGRFNFQVQPVPDNIAPTASIALTDIFGGDTCHCRQLKWGLSDVLRSCHVHQFSHRSEWLV